MNPFTDCPPKSWRDAHSVLSTQSHFFRSSRAFSGAKGGNDIMEWRLLDAFETAFAFSVFGGAVVVVGAAFVIDLLESCCNGGGGGSCCGILTVGFCSGVDVPVGDFPMKLPKLFGAEPKPIGIGGSTDLLTGDCGGFEPMVVDVEVFAAAAAAAAAAARLCCCCNWFCLCSCCS